MSHTGVCPSSHTRQRQGVHTSHGAYPIHTSALHQRGPEAPGGQEVVHIPCYLAGAENTHGASTPWGSRRHDFSQLEYPGLDVALVEPLELKVLGGESRAHLLSSYYKPTSSDKFSLIVPKRCGMDLLIFTLYIRKSRPK